MQHQPTSFWRYSLQLIMGCALVAGFAGTAEAQVKTLAGRIAISADGNAHDRDDIGAAAVSLAILEQANMKAKLVHFGYNNHVWFNGKPGMSPQQALQQKQDMTQSVTGARSRFGFPNSIFFSVIDNRQASYNHLAQQMRTATPNDPLYVLAMGPYEHICEAVKIAKRNMPAANVKYIVVVNHGDSNPLHTHNDLEGSGQSCNAASVRALGVGFKDIKNQNGEPNAVNKEGFKNPYTSWTWLANHADANLRWVHGRMKVAFPGRADVSDAGLVWYMVTGGPAKNGQQDGNPDDLSAFFK